MIRKYEEKDLLVIKNYYNEFNLEKLNNDIYSEKYVYVINNNVIGFIDFSIIYERAELNYIYVNKDQRGKKIASELMNYFIDYCSNLNCINITLEVDKKNVLALSLYKKFGFKVVANRKNYYIHGDAFVMMKELINSE